MKVRSTVRTEPRSRTADGGSGPRGSAVGLVHVDQPRRSRSRFGIARPRDAG